MNLKFAGNSDGWGMGFLLIFFPDDHHPQNPNPKKSTNSNPFSSFPIKNSNSSLLLLRAQSTISICLLLLLVTALLFTLSSLSPSAAVARRLLRQPQFQPPTPNPSHALHKMGALYRRGSRAMNDVVVAHVPETVTLDELKLFVRLFLRSSLAARSDLVFLLPERNSDFDDVVVQESDSFFRLLDRYSEEFRNGSKSVAGGFPVAQFLKLGKESEVEEPIWGRRRNRANSSEPQPAARLSYGSVVAFDVDELDPGNSLSGFLDHVPMSLRRWACYPMLLGRLRRNFKHVMLADVKELLLLGDPLGRVRGLSPESVVLHLASSGKHGKRGPGQAGLTRTRPVYSGMVMGGARGVRRVANEMLTGIARAAMQRKKKNPVTESGLLSQLAWNDFVLRKVDLAPPTESVPELSPLSESGVKSGMKNYTVVRRGNSNYLVIKRLCSFPIEFTVYNDC